MIGIIITLCIAITVIIGIFIWILVKNNTSTDNTDIKSAGIAWAFPKPTDTCSNKPRSINIRNIPQKTNIPVSMRINGTYPQPRQTAKTHHIVPFINIPRPPAPISFSWRTQGHDQIELPRDQGLCGCCYAVSIATVLGDRIALKNQLISPMPSIAYVTSFTFGPGVEYSGCDGGNQDVVVNYMTSRNKGVKLESCWPFKIISNGEAYGGPKPKYGNSDWIGPEDLSESRLANCCYDCCNVYSSIEFYIKPDTFKFFADNQHIPNGQRYFTQQQIDAVIEDIQYDIMENGPVMTAFVVYDAFYSYYQTKANNRIFTLDKCKNINNVFAGETNNSEFRGGHAVVITGWGTKNQDGRDVKYWEIRNSWGTSSIDNGYFYIEMSNENNTEYWLGIDVPCRYENPDSLGNYISIFGASTFEVEPISSSVPLEKSKAGNLLK